MEKSIIMDTKGYRWLDVAQAYEEAAAKLTPEEIESLENLIQRHRSEGCVTYVRARLRLRQKENKRRSK